MGVDHVEVALGHRNVHGFTQRASGMVQAGQHVDELGEVAEVLDGRIAAAFIEVADEGRAVNRGEDSVVATDGDVVCRVAGMLHIFARRRLDQRAHEALGEAHAVALGVGRRGLHISAGILPHACGLIVLIDVEADFLQNRFGIALDQFKLLVREGLIGPDGAADEARVLDGGRSAGGAAGIGTASGAATGGRGGGGLDVSHCKTC